MENVAVSIELRTSVPRPSLARTAPEVKISEAEPADLILKAIVTIFPAEPVKPGVGRPPLKLIVPALLEKVGSSTKRVKMDPLLLIETTSSRAVGNLIAASALFIALP